MHPLPPTDLPVEEGVGAVQAALADRAVAILQAPPGAGKTTVVPLRLLDEPWLDGGRIVVLEPRRLAVRAAATRMASLLGEDVGATVGYRTRDEARVGPATRVEVVTEGILTRRLQRDPSLTGTALVVFDEVHERNLPAEVALALLLDARPVLRPDLRVLAMSATVEGQRLAALLGGPDDPAPVITSAGRSFPIDVRWVPLRREDGVAAATARVVERALREEGGDVLVFLAGAADIRRVHQALAQGGRTDRVDVRLLHGSLPAHEQDVALVPSPAGRRRVVLATDIAETSLTVAGVRVVVDAGQVRTPRYDPRRGLSELRTGPTSRASADQRAGRAGRTEPGVAYRLWSTLEHAARRPFAEPEIAAADLSGLVLEAAVWGAPVSSLAFLDPPPEAAVEEARRLLVALGALDGLGKVTARGRAMVRLPVHPRLARMVDGAASIGPGGPWLACVLAALLEDRDVLRGRPDELPVDLAERVALVVGGASAAAAQQDRSAVAGARRRAGQLARRAGVQPGPVDVTLCGPALALAYPDRIAQTRRGARYRLRSGGGAWLAADDPLASAPFLVVAEMDADRRDSRIRLAAALDGRDVEQIAGDAITEVTTLAWDTGRNDLRARTERRLDGLVLAEVEGPARPGPTTVEALLRRVRAAGLGVLGWSESARALQARIAFARSLDREAWADVSDAALLDDLEVWLAPSLAEAVGQRDLAAVDVEAALRALVGYGQIGALERLAPTSLTLSNGHRLSVGYDDGRATAAARVQHLFGCTTHPSVGGGRVPVVLELLSPAGRPVQVTADLPGFWEGSWAAVRREMAGRYPKHPWPIDPASERPPVRRPR